MGLQFLQFCTTKKRDFKHRERIWLIMFAIKEYNNPQNNLFTEK